MKSFIAALRSLTLPFNATTGTRIVLDGITGLIRIYNASNQLEAEIKPGGVITVYNTALSPASYINLSGSLMSVVSGDGSHAVYALAGAASANLQVVDSSGSNVYMEVSTGSIPYSRWESRVGGASVNYLQVLCDQDHADIDYTPNTGNPMLLRFLENVGVMLTPTQAATAKRGVFWDTSDGFLKSQTFNVSTAARTTEGWNNLTLPAGWVADQPTQYKLYPDGVVRLRGIANANVSPIPNGTTLATLPAGYRPAQYTLIPNAYDASATKGRLEITTAGAINVYDAPNDLPCLDSVTFSTI